MIPLVCVSVTCPECESCPWGQWKHTFSEIKAAHAAGRSRDCFQAGEICPNAMHRALHCMSGAAERWDARIATGLTDADLRVAIAKEFGEFTSGSRGPGWTCMTGPKLWIGNAVDGQGGRRKPDLEGKALVAAVREFLTIPLPLKHEEPVCENSQVAASQALAPWAGLPLMQMMEARG